MVKDCPIARPLRGRDVDRPGVLQAPGRAVPGPRHPRAQRRRASTTTACSTHQLRPRRRADGRPDQPLQHDVRPVLHGRQPGGLRPRARAGTRSRRSSTTRIAIKPRRQMSVQFSGGEPTLSPYFLDAVALLQGGRLQQRPGGHQRHRVRQEPGVLPQGAPRRACATSTCSSTASATPPTQHRARRQPVRREAAGHREPARRRRRHRPGDHDHQRHQQRAGRAASSSSPSTTRRRSRFLSFQPVSFTGRDEEITDERRAAQRYTLAHLAHDVKNQTGIGEPLRDWFPISFMTHVRRLGRPGARARPTSGASSAAAATRTAASAWP
ncbi:MAG: hypothetical protein MZW92_24935 [Comamonadaceae bacterium]|nr:hypothetical protein [Comamonadaceae bacterium]